MVDQLIKWTSTTPWFLCHAWGEREPHLLTGSAGKETAQDPCPALIYGRKKNKTHLNFKWQKLILQGSALTISSLAQAPLITHQLFIRWDFLEVPHQEGRQCVLCPYPLTIHRSVNLVWCPLRHRHTTHSDTKQKFTFLTTENATATQQHKSTTTVFADILIKNWWFDLIIRVLIQHKVNLSNVIVYCYSYLIPTYGCPISSVHLILKWVSV